MRKRVQIALAVLLVAVAGMVARQVLRPSEPVYQGKGLTVWLEQYAKYQWSAFGTFPNSELGEQAETAIRHIGTNAIPICLELMTIRESPLKANTRALIPNRWLARLHWHDADESRVLGGYGIAVWGAEAKPYVPGLVALLHDKDPNVRSRAAWALFLLGPVAVDALPSLIKCLDDPDDNVRLYAVSGLGTVHQQPERVIPVLIQLVEDYRADTNRARANRHANAKPPVWAAIESLSKFGAQANPVVPTLVELLDDRGSGVRVSATNALKAIDPEAAARAGVK